MKVAMKRIYKYILSSIVLFVPVLANAQDPPIYSDGYHIENGIATKKSVSETMDGDGYYTLTLETFATGATSITNKSIPSDVVLVLDLSTSMGGHRSYEAMDKTTLSYDDVVNNPEGKVYLRWDPMDQYYYQIFGLAKEVDGRMRYFLYWIQPSRGVLFLNSEGSGPDYVRYTQTGASDAPASERYRRATTNTLLGSVYVYTQSNTGSYIVRDVLPHAGLSPQQSDSDVTTVPDLVFYNAVVGQSGVKNGIAYADNPGDPIVTSLDASITFAKGTSRTSELIDAVQHFITEIDNNSKNRNVNGYLVPRDQPLHNRVSIVTFAKDLMGGKYETNLLDLDATTAEDPIYSDNASYLKSIAEKFTLKSGTVPESGLNEAIRLFGLPANQRAGTAGEDYLRTVLFFTDGQPDSYQNPITSAYSLKHDNSATVWSVGLFGGGASANNAKFLKLVSSNCPDAQSWESDQPADVGPDSVNYYHDASEGSNLTEIFKTIAQASGGSEKTVPSATQVVDGVTNSFSIPVPDGADAPTLASAKVTIFTRDINPAGTTWGSGQSLTLVQMSEAEIQEPDPEKEYMTDEGKVGAAIVNGRLYVMGFDYSKADSGESSLDGNWVGWRYPDGTDASKVCAGKELVIQFKIQGDPDATGGDSTQTNTPDSGIYVPTYDEEGNFQGYEPANSYTVPAANIPINIVIQKIGLRHGESATIQIYRAPQSGEYNTTTGKLKPYLPNGDDSWENFSKVILTNKGEDGAPVTETLLCLDPTYVYLMKEDDWGWSYNLVIDAIDTSMQEMNPFVFTNTEKTDAVRHAEAASFNRFGEDLHGRTRVETVKSSKVKTFITPPATGSGE